MTSTRLASLARAGRLVLSLLALILATITAHEAAHIALALALKVPLASFTWFDPHYLAPVLVSGQAEKAIGMTVVDYAGGLVAGACWWQSSS